MHWLDVIAVSIASPSAKGFDFDSVNPAASVDVAAPILKLCIV